MQRVIQCDYIVFALLFIILGAGSCECSNKSHDPFPKIDIPAYENAFNKDVFTDFDKKIKALNYIVNIPYPANQVVNFYEHELKKKGFTKKEIGSPQWETYIDSTISGSPSIRQLAIIWQNTKLHAEAILALIYKNEGKGWGDDLHVTCQLQTIVDTSEIDAFMKELKDAGDDIYINFMKLLDSYRDKSGDVDLERAVKENQNNIYLQNYKAIVDQITKQVESEKHVKGSDLPLTHVDQKP